jgi:adenosine deaminase
VRAIENPDLVKHIADEGIVLEVCPGSNVALKRLPSFADHPFPKLRRRPAARSRCHSDDPPYFWTSLKREYDIAREHWGMGDKV